MTLFQFIATKKMEETRLPGCIAVGNHFKKQNDVKEGQA